MNPLSLSSCSSLRVVVLVGLLLQANAVAAAASGQLTLPAVFAQISSRTEIKLARENLIAAQTVLKRLQADSTTLKADLLTAQNNVAYAQASLAQASAQAQLDVAQALFKVVATERRQQVDQGRLSLAQTQVNVAQERLKLGSGNALAIDQAQSTAIQVQQDLKGDQVQLSVEIDVLRNLLSLSGPPKVNVFVPPAPANVADLASIRQAALAVPLVRKSAGALEVAKLQLAQAQSVYVPQVQRNAAQQTLIAAQLDYQTQLTTAQQAAETAYVAALDARAKLQAAQAVLDAQQAALRTAQAQAKAGTVAPLQVQALSVGTDQAQLTLLLAQQQAYLTGLMLETAAPVGVK